jgi:dolichol-phosphate mannosyltransferase
VADGQILTAIETQAPPREAQARVDARSPAGRPTELSIIVPTFNERDNVAAVVERLDRALAAIAWEVIFVDDASPDGTGQAVRTLARTDRRVRLISRHNRRGLSSAVIEGGLAASGAVIAVMDGDLQHDESVLPELFRRVAQGEADIAAASRFLSTVNPEGLSSTARTHMSNAGNALTNLFFRLKLTDPLTGFFAMRRETLERALPKLSELGFKILLDVITSLKPRPKVAEIPFRFRPRARGQSKLDGRVMYDFFLFFLEKAIGRVTRVPARFLSFMIVNGLGMLVHLAVLAPAMRFPGMEFAGAQLLATIAAMYFNYAVNNLITYNDASLKGFAFWRGFVKFGLLCSLGVFANVGVASMIYREFHSQLLIVPAIAGALITVVWNYVATKFFVWGRARG